MTTSPRGPREPGTPEPEPQRPHLSGGELQRRAISGSIWTAIAAIVSVPLAFLCNAVVARLLGPSEYGKLAFLTLALGVVVMISNLGVSDGVIQWGAAAEARGNRKAADKLLRKSLGYHVIIQLPILMLAVFVLAWDFPLWVKAALVVSVAVPAAFGSSSLAISIENKTAAGARLVMGTNVILQISLVSAAVITHSAPAVWATRAVASSCLMPLNLILLDKRRRRVVVRLAPPRQFPPGFWRYSTQICLASVLGVLVFSRSEIFLLQALASPEALGLFALAFGIAAQITAPVDALLGPLIPSVAGLLSSAAASATRAVERAMRFAALLSGGIVALALPPLYFLLPLIYGSEYRSAAALVVPLVAASCLQSCVSPVIAFLNARRRSGLIVRVYGIALVVGIAVAVAVIPPLGVWGAVISNVAGQVTAIVMLGTAEAREHDRSLLWLIVQGKAWALGLVSAACAIGLPAVLIANSPGSAPVAAAIGAACYALGIRLFGGGITEGDRRALAGSLHPRLARVLLKFDN